MIDSALFNTSHRTLKLLAAMVWYSGFVVLFFKSSLLFTEAGKLTNDYLAIYLAIASGVFIGFIKARYLYTRLCFRNLQRINNLVNAKIWQFYRIQFFVFLLSMILLGLILSRSIQGNYSSLLILAIIELSVATALLGSCHCFWKNKDDNR